MSGVFVDDAFHSVKTVIIFSLKDELFDEAVVPISGVVGVPDFACKSCFHIICILM